MALDAIKDVGQKYTDKVVAAAKAHDTKALSSLVNEQAKKVASAVTSSFTQSSNVTALTNKLSAATHAAATAASQSPTASTAAASNSVAKALDAYATAQNRAKSAFAINRNA